MRRPVGPSLVSVQRCDNPRAFGICASDRLDKPVVKALCPVCNMIVVINDKTPSHEYKGVRYYFCSPEHKVIFDSNPEKYIQQREQVPF